MCTTLIVLLVIFIYVCLVINGWVYIHLLHSYNDIWSQFETSWGEIFLVFCPGVNLGLIIMWLVEYPISSKKPQRNKNKFFKIK